MNLTTGKFTAPRAGIYSFAFAARAYFPPSSSRIYIYLNMNLNGNFIGSGYADEISTAEQYETLAYQSTLSLQAGDQIWFEMNMSPGTYLFDNGNRHTHFSGCLLEENVSQSLNVK